MFSSEKFEKTDAPNELQLDYHDCSYREMYTGSNVMQTLLQLNFIIFRNSSEGEMQK